MNKTYVGYTTGEETAAVIEKVLSKNLTSALINGPAGGSGAFWEFAASGADKLKDSDINGFNSVLRGED